MGKFGKKTEQGKTVFTIKNHPLLLKAKKCSVAKQQVSDLEEVVALLMANPIKIQTHLIRLKANDDAVTANADPAGQHWPDDLSHFANVPKYWLRQVLSEVEPRFTSRVMTNIDAADKLAVMKLSECAFQLDGRTKVPPQAASDPQILSRVLRERYVHGNEPLKKLFTDEKCLDRNGYIDWIFAGPWAFLEEEIEGESDLLLSYNLQGHKVLLLF